VKKILGFLIFFFVSSSFALPQCPLAKDVKTNLDKVSVYSVNYNGEFLGYSANKPRDYYGTKSLWSFSLEPFIKNAKNKDEAISIAKKAISSVHGRPSESDESGYHYCSYSTTQGFLVKLYTKK